MLQHVETRLHSGSGRVQTLAFSLWDKRDTAAQYQQPDPDTTLTHTEFAIMFMSQMLLIWKTFPLEPIPDMNILAEPTTTC
jgi:hypothetical protein